MTTEMAAVGPSSGTLALTGDQIEWTPVQQAALAHIGIEDAPQADQQVFMHVAQRTGLDPFARQIYMIGRREKGDDGQYYKKWTIQTGIDGFRLTAERHQQYAGTLDPEWCGPDGVWHDSWVARNPPVMARVKVLRHDRQHPIALPVRFDEFAARFKDGNLMGQWKSKPAHMIGKVAEAASLRKAFPQDLSGVYTDDEMAHVDNPPPARVFDHAQTSAAPTVAELTGQPAAAADDAAQAAEDAARAAEDAWNEGLVAENAGEAEGADTPDAATPLVQPPGSAGPPEQRRTKQLFALLREADVGDRHVYASGVLRRDVATFTTLTAGDVETLITNLQEITMESETDRD